MRLQPVLRLKTNIDITAHGYFGAAPCETRSAGYPPRLEQKHKYKVQLSHDFGNKVHNVKISQVYLLCSTNKNHIVLKSSKLVYKLASFSGENRLEMNTHLK